MTASAKSAAAPGQAGADAAQRAIRVLVVDDSVVVRGLVARWLAEEADIAVVGTPRNGRVAVDEATKHKPDVVILDVEMPELDGLEALPLLLRAVPGVVVIMASTLTRRNAETSVKALALGARDCVPKPEASHGLATASEFRREVIAKVKALGASQRDRRLAALARGPARSAARPVAAGLGERPGKAEGTAALRPVSGTPPRILAIGSSTGGPQALMEVLKGGAALFQRVPVVITQHMPPTFTAILAEHLARVTHADAREAVEGEPVVPGRIYVAPGGLHMALHKAGDAVQVRLTDGPAINYCKPAVDPLFDSVAQIYGGAALALVLTGMGSDGAKGALAIARAGGTVLAQDEASSVVWGMPGATVAAGAVAGVLALPQIGPRLLQIVMQGRA